MSKSQYTRSDFLRVLGLAAVSATPACSVLFSTAPAGKKAAGVTVLKRDRCDSGYRLYSSRQTEVAHMIDIDGREVQRWSYPQGHTWHYAEMLPNGHLVAIIKDVMILELDWDSKLVWKAEITAHHDFDQLENGNKLVVCREYVVNEALRPGELKSDYIVELTPEGEVAWEWHADQHVYEIAKLVPVKFPLANQDWGHMNTVESLPDGPPARQDARFKARNILFSCRNIDTIGVIDRESGKVVWAWGPGTLDRQHMPTMLPNGHILVYDNGNTLKRTRILELEPLTGKIVWQYQADPPTSFYSPTRGSNQRLPNGNTFIAESDSGRLCEVTPEGEVVWEFLNPDLRPDGERMPLYRAVRYPRVLVETLLARHGGPNGGNE